MSATKLLIRKRMLQAQGKVRPTCFAQAMVDGRVRGLLETHFAPETLFRRAAYSQSWPEGTIRVPAALAPAMAAFLKNDACPEITVKTLLAGQSHQGTNAWEMMSFELIAKVAFDNLLQLISATAELDREIYYLGTTPISDLSEFEADTAADVREANSSAAAA